MLKTSSSCWEGWPAAAPETRGVCFFVFHFHQRRLAGVWLSCQKAWGLLAHLQPNGPDVTWKKTADIRWNRLWKGRGRYWLVLLYVSGRERKASVSAWILTALRDGTPLTMTRCHLLRSYSGRKLELLEDFAALQSASGMFVISGARGCLQASVPLCTLAFWFNQITRVVNLL